MSSGALYRMWLPVTVSTYSHSSGRSAKPLADLPPRLDPVAEGLLRIGVAPRYQQHSQHAGTSRQSQSCSSAMTAAGCMLTGICTKGRLCFAEPTQTWPAAVVMRRKGMPGTRGQKALKTVTRDQASLPSSFTACTARIPLSVLTDCMWHVSCICLHDVYFIQTRSCLSMNENHTCSAMHLLMCQNDIPESRLLAWHRQCGSALGVHWRGSALSAGYLPGSRNPPELQAAQCGVCNMTAWTIQCLRLCPTI